MKQLIYLAIVVAFLGMTGCGYVNRVSSNFTGKGYDECVDGVVYLQFVSGVSVKYNQDGTLAKCQ